MDRQFVYPGQIPLETDLLNTNRNTLTALGMLIQDLFGTSTVFSGLTVVPTVPATLGVNVNPGRVYSYQNLDNTAYSSLAANTAMQIMKQGILSAAQNFATPAPVTSGYSVNYLISASFLEVDINPVVLPYYNAANPQVAWSGPGGLGATNATTRQDTVQLTLTAGVPAATGTQTTPATPAGTTPLYVVTVAYGQTTVTASNITAVAGAPYAPTGGYFAAVGERFSSIINVSASSTLTIAAAGALVNITATGTTQTLPAASSLANGESITLVYMQSSGSATISRNGSDTLSFGQGSSTSSIMLSPGEEVQFVSNGSNGWVSAGQTISTAVPTVGLARNLRASLASASASLSYTADELVVATALGGQKYTIHGLSATLNSANTGANGIATGSDMPANGYLAIYAIYNPTTATAALLGVDCSSAKAPEVCAATMPAGYTASALIGVWPTASSQFVSASQCDRKLARPRVTALTLTSSSTAIPLTALAIANAVPMNACAIDGMLQMYFTTATTSAPTFVLSDASGNGDQWFYASANSTYAQWGGSFAELLIPTPQNMYYAINNSNATSVTYYIYVSAYRF